MCSHVAADDRPRGRGDLPVPAQRLADHHSGHCRAGFDRRHLRRHVRVRLQPRQPLAHGTVDRRGLRRRRCDRDGGKHRAPHRNGKEAAAGRLDAPGRSASPSCRFPFAGRGLHPAAAHGRHGRASVPGVRGHGDRRHRRVAAGIADADAGAGRAAAAAGATRTTRPHRARPRVGLRRDARGL